MSSTSLRVPPLDFDQFGALGLELGIPLALKPIELTVKLRAELLEELGCHQPFPKTVQDRPLENLDPYVEAVIAGATVARGGAAEQVPADLHVASPTCAALRQSRDEIARPLLLPERPVAFRIGPGVPPDRRLPSLRTFPEILGDNPEIGNVLDGQCACVVDA
jgi:hypothetical protein